MARDIYRGYVIEHGKDGWQIYLDNKLVCSQPSKEFAFKWVDVECKRITQSK